MTLTLALAIACGFLAVTVCRLAMSLYQARRWSRVWKHRAKTYRARARASLKGHLQEKRHVRLLEEQIAALQDARPLEAGPELEAYVEDLRERHQVQVMYTIDLETRLGTCEDRKRGGS